MISPKMFIFSFSSWMMASRHSIAYLDCLVDEAFKMNLSMILWMMSSSWAHQGMDFNLVEVLVEEADLMAPTEAPTLVRIWRTTWPTSGWSPLSQRKGRRY